MMSEPAPAVIASVYLVSGEDDSLVAQALGVLIEEILRRAELDSSSVEEYSGSSTDEGSVIAAAIDACRTPAFLSPRRLVVVRDGEALSSEEVTTVITYLKEPVETTVLVLTFAGRRVPPALSKAVQAHGSVITAQPATTRARGEWFAEHVRSSTVRIDASGVALLQTHLGQDLSRLEGVLSMLESAYGTGHVLSSTEIAPFLGEQGGVAPWDLTDAIDAGDGVRSIAALRRMLQGGERHPLQVLVLLHRHYSGMLSLDGAEIADDQQVVALTGLSPFPARKALAQARRLGHDRIARAIGLLAEADLDLRGRSGLPAEATLEILTARLSQNSRLRTGASTSRHGAGRRGR